MRTPTAMTASKGLDSADEDEGAVVALLISLFEDDSKSVALMPSAEGEPLAA